MHFASFGTNVLGDKKLQLPLHLSKLTMSGIIRVGINMNGSSFIDRHFSG